MLPGVSTWALRKGETEKAPAAPPRFRKESLPFLASGEWEHPRRAQLPGRYSALNRTVSVSEAARNARAIPPAPRWADFLPRPGPLGHSGTPPARRNRPARKARPYRWPKGKT